MAIYRKKHLNTSCHKMNRFLMLHEVINRVMDVFKMIKQTYKFTAILTVCLNVYCHNNVIQTEHPFTKRDCGHVSVPTDLKYLPSDAYTILFTSHLHYDDA
jgi:hypothetical protein